MKGVILAGGTGTRLTPYTKVINKHLLPVGRFPMIYWPLRAMEKAGVKDVIVVTNEKDVENFQAIIPDLPLNNLNITWTIQEKPRGIADALSKTEDQVKGEKLLVILGDNVFTDNLKTTVDTFQATGEGALLFVKKVADPERYGIAVTDKRGNVVKLLEKPREVDSNLCVTGIYLYDEKVFEFMKEVTPSERGELEITDINKLYLKSSTVNIENLKGFWCDAGTIESLNYVNSAMFNYE
ncbi:glucose-1-phosphate thymidylyltransferase [Evansella vedderi]|uniref:Glucose-1-phosphate thymidylyltransferase n=1 Tax=Evansella vedderi TaxID=38282 RepID=A0ABT9ZVW0_9BACI|nr:sugar phosphate nucleotidyltransferase [Evansella vedderi]MDQ0255377.1 glucose-1-phosphate thymidylyltransferase [Evansella vedderi]